MANTLKKIFVPGLDQVAQTYTVESWHVSQSVDAFTGIEAYDVTISGSLILTGSLAIEGLTNPSLTDVLTIDTTTGQIYYTSSTAIAPINNYFTSSVTNTYTSSTVNNNFSTSTVTNSYTSSTVNNPGGSDTQIQYNSGSAFGASPSFRYDYTIESLAQGNSTTASANFSHAEGILTEASFLGAHAEGNSTIAAGISSHAEGELTTAQGTGAHAEGYESLSSGNYSHAEGYQNISSGQRSHAEGDNTISSGTGSHAEGYQTIASGSRSHAEGDNTRSSGISSHAEGYQTIASGQYSHAEGYQTIASGQASHAEGLQTTASGNYSRAGGFNTKAIGLNSVAFGGSNIANGSYSFVAGFSNNAGGSNSTAFGFTTYAGPSALSAGIQTSASGQYSAAYGQQTIAAGQASFTAGQSTTANGNYQTAVGFFNELDSSPNAFIVGGGTSAGRKTLVFASGSQFQLSGSFAPQYRNLGNIGVAIASSGLSVTNRDYNVVFTANNVTALNKNEILLPANVPVGTVIYLQRVAGNVTGSLIRVSGSSGHLVNGAAGYSFPTGSFARRMFVFSGTSTGWYTEPNPIV
jgi:hypothetical protein